MAAMTIIVFLVYAALIAAVVRFGRPWANPVFLVLLYYLFNYPVRAVLVDTHPDTFNVNSFTRDEIRSALEYSTLYVIVFVGAYLLLLWQFRIRFEFAGIREDRLDSGIFRVATVLALASGAIKMGYEISVGGSFSLGSDIEDLQRPFWVNLAVLPYSLKWFALCMGALLWLKNRSPAVGLATVILACLLAAEALASTAKGIVVAFVLLFLFVDNLFTRRVLRLGVVAIGGVVAMLFSGYSYYARFEGAIGLGSLQEQVDFLGTAIASNFDDIVSAQLTNIVDRGTYYLDALVMMDRSGAVAEAGPYAYGSLIELLNLVPRAFELIPEQYSFDRYATWAVWGERGFSQIFVGRIGESFFVLGYGGLIYALIHATIFAVVAGRWRGMSGSIAGVSLYFAVLQGWLYQDASLVYQLKNLIAIVLCYLAVEGGVRLASAGPRGSPAVRGT